MMIMLSAKRVLKARYQRVPIMALTATATEEVKQDILRKLNIDRTAAIFKVQPPPFCSATGPQRNEHT